MVQFLPSVFPEAVLALPEFQGARLLLGQAGLGVKFPTDLARSLEQRMMALTEERGIEAWLELTSLLNDLSKVPGKILADAAYRNQRTFKMESRLGRIIDHIENCCDEELSLADAARFAHLTSTSFSRYFRKMTGKSFVEFRNACRLRKACQGLAESDLSILEIALACGFQNLANFNRQFRKFAGLPPREYRKLRAGAVI